MNDILMYFGFTLSIVSIIIQIRNNWVYEHRLKLNYFNEDRIHVINMYLDYGEMMARFWIWDIEKLRKQK